MFTAALIGGLTLLAVPLVAVLQLGEFRAAPAGSWPRAWRNAGLGMAAGLAGLALLGVLLPGRPLLDTRHPASDAAVVVAIFAGLGMMLLAAMAFNFTLYRAAGKLDARQAKWTGAMIVAIYALVVGGFSWAVLA